MKQFFDLMDELHIADLGEAQERVTLLLDEDV
jgi:hypothetical protein